MTENEIPHCGNCTNNDCKYLPLKDRVGRARKWNGGVLKHVEFTPRSFTEERGCLFHPHARAYLMADVLQELEKKMLECGSKVMFDRQDAYETAIALIRDGVKK